MKILAISDEVCEAIYTPTLKRKYPDVDLVVGCGDLPYYYLEFIVNALDVPLYYVHGNHDKHEQYMSDGRTVYRAEGCVEIDDRTATVPAGPSAAGPVLLLGGLLLGVAEILLVALMPELAGYRDAVAFGLLILILLFRPSGLMGTKLPD